MSETGKMAAIILAFETSRMQAEAMAAAEIKDTHQAKRCEILERTFDLLRAVRIGIEPEYATIIRRTLALCVVAVVNRRPSVFRKLIDQLYEKPILCGALDRLKASGFDWWEPTAAGTDYTPDEIVAETRIDTDWVVARSFLRVVPYK